ncbi:MAG TPA: TIGR02147 family protein [Bdellovibrio sp.]|nr:TIGR02147 family protein [Bdellovibrio sp.]
MQTFEYLDYKKFLNGRLQHGLQKKFAIFLGCQPAFLSQVLRGKPDLSLEQGMLATEYFQLNSHEAEYFMLALQNSRAGSLKLKKYFEDKMTHLRLLNQRIDSRIGNFVKLDDSAKSVFFSSWKYSFIYVLLSLPDKNQLELIKAKTKLSETEISRVIKELTDLKLIQKSRDRWQPTKNRIHLNPEDIQISNHHRNYRAFSSRELEEIKPKSLHFSSAIALSIEDAQKVKEVLLQTIQEVEAIIKPSEEETIRVLCMDFFEPGSF